MKASTSLRLVILLLPSALPLATCCSARAQSAPVRKATEDVNAPELRGRSGLQPNANDSRMGDHDVCYVADKPALAGERLELRELAPR